MLGIGRREDKREVVPVDVLVTGANGYVGRHLRAEAERAVWGELRVRAWVRGADASRGELPLDVGNAASIGAQVRALRPAAVINLAALAEVGTCRADPARADRVNTRLPTHLAEACHEVGAHLVHVSTDMVFDGAAAPYAEDDPARPLSVYGRSKLAGEEAALAVGGSVTVARLPLLYGESLGTRRGASDGLGALLGSGGRARLFVDERRSALHVRVAARSLLQLCAMEAQGRLHVAARGALSRYELGLLFARRFGWDEERLEPCRQDEVPSPEPRPADLELAVGAALAIGLRLPEVRAGLEAWGE